MLCAQCVLCIHPLCPFPVRCPSPCNFRTWNSERVAMHDFVNWNAKRWCLLFFVHRLSFHMRERWLQFRNCSLSKTGCNGPTNTSDTNNTKTTKYWKRARSTNVRTCIGCVYTFSDRVHVQCFAMGFIIWGIFGQRTVHRSIGCIENNRPSVLVVKWQKEITYFERIFICLQCNDGIGHHTRTNERTKNYNLFMTSTPKRSSYVRDSFLSTLDIRFHLKTNMKRQNYFELPFEGRIEEIYLIFPHIVRTRTTFISLNFCYLRLLLSHRWMQWIVRLVRWANHRQIFLSFSHTVVFSSEN